MNKEFDCVEMKRKGAEILRKKLNGLSLEEELMFWQERTDALRKEHKLLKKRQTRKLKA